MHLRPKSVTIISWFLIITGAIGLPYLFMSMNNPQVAEIMSKSPVPIPAQIGIAVLSLVISIISGIGMLKGQNVARLLYVGWNCMTFLYSLITSPVKMMLIPGVVIFAVIVFLLYRPATNQYFAKP